MINGQAAGILPNDAEILLGSDFPEDASEEGRGPHAGAVYGGAGLKQRSTTATLFFLSFCVGTLPGLRNPSAHACA